MDTNKRNGLVPIIAQAIEEMEVETGFSIPLENINLAELERRTGLSRSKLRTLQAKGFKEQPHGLKGKPKGGILKGYTGILDSLLSQGITNSVVCLERLRQEGFTGGRTTVKDYIAAHKYLVPVRRTQTAPQGNRGRRYMTGPGEAFQMDWGFTKVLNPNGAEYQVACFAMICHHCGQRYVEFFPNAKQENLFIGMIHAFQYMGIPQYVLTDNMKSVVVKRDLEGHPIWQKDYEAFMKAVGFQTKLCKPRHPFTKGKVERLVRFVKENFLIDRTFQNISDLNWAALNGCNTQNTVFHRALGFVPQEIHFKDCAAVLREFSIDSAIRGYLCPERRLSFDGFVSYEGIRFGVPSDYLLPTVRITRDQNSIRIFSYDFSRQLVSYPVTWSRQDQICAGQFEEIPQPEEFPTARVKTTIQQLPPTPTQLSFEKFNFDDEVLQDD